MVKKCTRCKKEKPIDKFNFKSKDSGLRHYQCTECSRILIKNHYYKNREYYLKKARVRNSKNRSEVQTFIRDYLLKNPCIDCGESDIIVLEFDHKDIKDKLTEVSNLIQGRYPLEKVKEEIKKYAVRCANCHRRRTAKKFGWFRNNKDTEALVA